MIFIILTSILIILWRITRPRNFPPGPPILPIVGSIPFIKLYNFHLSLEKMREKYGPVIGLNFYGKYVVAVCGKKEVEEVLRRDEFQGRPIFNENAEGIMFSEGEFWMQQKQFSLRYLDGDNGFGKNRIEDLILDEIDDFFGVYFVDPKPVQVSGLFNMSSGNVLWAMMGGKRYPHDDREFQILLDCLRRRFRSGATRGSFKKRHPILSKLLPFLKQVKEEECINENMRTFFEKAFTEHKETKTEDARDFIDIYLNELESSKELHPSFSEHTLKNICSDFFSAGVESIGNSLGFNILYCVLYPEWQDRMFDEIVSVIGTVKKPSLTDKNSLHIVEAFMTEVSRCNTISSLAVPHKTLKLTTLNGYKIPKGTVVLVSIYAALHDEDHWGDPENFRPDRFLDSRGNFFNDKGLPVFGSGERICPGESLARDTIFLFFTSIIRKYRITLPDGHQMPTTIPLSGFIQAPQPFEIIALQRA